MYSTPKMMALPINGLMKNITKELLSNPTMWLIKAIQ